MKTPWQSDVMAHGDTPGEDIPLAREPEAPFDDLVQLAATICGTPIALISLGDEKGQWIKSKFGLSDDETPQEISFCAYPIDQPGVFVVPDARADARFADNPLVANPPAIRFFAGVRLIASGSTVGTLCVMDRAPRQLDSGVECALRALGRQVVILLEYRRSAQELARSEVATRQLLKETRRSRAALLSILEDQAQAEKGLRESNERFRTVARATNDAIWDWSVATDRMWWSEGLKELFGYKLERNESDLTWWLERVHPDDVQRVRAVFFEVLNSAQKFWSDEYRFRRADGSFAEVFDRGHIERGPDLKAVRAIGAMADISARKQMEAALRNTEERMQAVMENLAEGLIIADLEGKALHWNRAAMAMHGFSGLDAVRKPLMDFTLIFELATLAGDVLPFDQWPVQRIYRGEEVRDLDLRIRRRGTDWERIYSYGGGRITDLAGREVVFVAITDVTDRHRAIEAMRESEARFATVFNLNPVACMVIQTPSGRIFDGNEAFCRLTGFTHAELVGHTTADLGFWASQQRRAQLLEAVAKDGRAHNFEAAIRQKSGTVRDVLLSVEVIELKGERYLLAMISDITERKLSEQALRSSEERFREIAENIHEVFWMTDPKKNRMLYISPAYEKIWGRSCESLYAEPGNWLVAIHPDDRARVMEAAMTKQERGTYDETYRILQPSGMVRWIRDRAFPIRDSSGQVQRVVGTAEDITQFRRLEEQYRQAQKLEAIGTLAGGIAHDFNNILGAIVGYTALVKSTVMENAEATEFLGEIENASSRAADLVRQILAFSRQQEQERSLLQIRHVVAESVKLLRATIPSTIEFNVSLGSGLPAVLSNATQIHQILMNLGTNAWHAMRDRSGRLDIKLEALTLDAHAMESDQNLHPGPYIRLTVADTGHGMDQATKERIFEPFFTTKAVDEGTGLGLAVVHGIMQSHEGAIVVQSEPGVGTTFELYFPAAAGVAGESETTPRAIPQGQGERILVVDDEEPLARLGRKMLEQLGYLAESQTNPMRAFEAVLAAPDRFDLIVVDQTMPKLTGLEFAQQVLKLRPALPIILMTGYHANLTAEGARAAGVKELLYKPISLERLGACVNRLLLARKTSG